MGEVAIRVNELGKQYRLGENVRYRTLRESWRNALWRDTQEVRRNIIWALRDVSFEVNQGEVVGVIGRNGAGKSTLLKILSRITRPTTGHVDIHGRVGSLLEVGTGFHPELTGRENMFLNGAILGMTRREVQGKFDEIVSFAEIEKFLDTPVKRYSSGMYIRLAFAVAAHLEPEILLVDEVLAVGDAAFQRKCLGKMEDVSKQGRTVLFVSHNLAAVSALCQRSILLAEGALTCDKDTDKTIDAYMELASDESSRPISERSDRRGNGTARILDFKITSVEDREKVKCDDRLKITIGYESAADLVRPKFLVGVYDHLNRPVFFLDSSTERHFPERLPNRGEVICKTGPINLTPGKCSVNVAVISGNEIADHVIHACMVDVQEVDFHGSGRLTDRSRALCLLDENWLAT